MKCLSFILTLLAAIVLLVVPINAQGNATIPEQIRLSYPGDGQMTIVWNTMSSTAESVVLYSPKKGGPYTIVTGTDYTFLNTGLEFRTEIIHVVTLSGLKPKTRYYYVVGSRYDKNSLSPEMSFNALQLTGDTSSLQFAVFGDFGLVNARSLPRLINDTAAGLFDMVLHVGDIAYNLQDDNGRVGDGFLNSVQPISSTIPYHYCVGNHEQDLLDTFHGFKERFAMPMVDYYENMYYSVDVGPIHFIAFSTEHYFSLEDPFVGLQYEWLINDLIQANKNRAKVPWIIMYGHRPMYCSNISLEPPKKSTTSDMERQKMFKLQREAEKLFMADPYSNKLKRDNPPPSQDCSSEAEQIREGFDWFGIRIFGVEKLLYEYGVDLYVCGHEHSYERSYPVYNSNVMNGSVAEPYVNPKATVHMVAGSAGCSEGLEYFGPVGMGPWSAFRSATYGYARMKVFNSTHMYWEQLLDSTGQVLDQFWLVNYNHGSFGPGTLIGL